MTGRSINPRIIKKEERVKQSVALFGDKFDYTLIPDGVNSKFLFTITCKRHNYSFKTSWNTHLSAWGGCKPCRSEMIGKALAHTTEQFIEKGITAHGSRYDYSKVDYVDQLTPVEIICKEHGSFWQRPDKHRIGQGCQLCAKNGFSHNKPAHLYVFQDGTRVKVGITNRKVETRLGEINLGGGSFSLVDKFYCEVGKDCFTQEFQLLKFLKQNYDNTVGTFDGVTESFEDVDVSVVLNYIKEMRSTIDK